MSASRIPWFARSVWSRGGASLARKCVIDALEDSSFCCGRAAAILDGGGRMSELGAACSGRFFASIAGGRSRLSKSGGGCTPAQAGFVVPSTAQGFFRDGQLRGYASGFRGQGGRMDIGARARQNQARRLWTIAISGSLVAGFIIVVLNTFQENMMFYITPSQALEKYYIDPSKNRFRLGGLVLEGSVHHSKIAAEMEFVVTDLANEILVRYRGALPDLFREGHSVVAEGFLRPIDSYPGRPEPSNDLTAELAEKAKQAGCYFTAVEVLAKHDEKYMPKEVAVAIEKNKAAQEAQQLASSKEIAQIPIALESPPPASGGKRKGVSQTPAIAQKYEFPS